MIPISGSVYDQNTAEKQAGLWQILTEAHDRELNSQYEIMVSSIGNIYFDTRYHLRAANDVRITRNGPTQETVYGTGGGTVLKIKADKNFVTTYSSYKVTTKGDESITTLFSHKLYMGIYQEMKIGSSLTVSLSKSIFTMGGFNTGELAESIDEFIECETLCRSNARYPIGTNDLAGKIYVLCRDRYQTSCFQTRG